MTLYFNCGRSGSISGTLRYASYPCMGMGGLPGQSVAINTGQSAEYGKCMQEPFSAEPESTPET